MQITREIKAKISLLFVSLLSLLFFIAIMYTQFIVDSSPSRKYDWTHFGICTLCMMSVCNSSQSATMPIH